MGEGGLFTKEVNEDISCFAETPIGVTLSNPEEVKRALKKILMVLVLMVAVCMMIHIVCADQLENYKNAYESTAALLAYIAWTTVLPILVAAIIVILLYYFLVVRHR